MSDKVFVFKPFDWYGKAGTFYPRKNKVGRPKKNDGRDVMGFKGKLLDKKDANILVEKNKKLIDGMNNIYLKRYEVAQALKDLAKKEDKIYKQAEDLNE